MIKKQYSRNSDKFAYCLQIGKIGGNLVKAYIEVVSGAENESLILEFSNGNTTIVYSAKYLFSPVFAGEFLIFSAWDENGDCPLLAVRISKDVGKVMKISGGKGRIKNIRAENQAIGNDIWISYEKRNGKRSSVFGAYHDGKEWVADIPLTDGNHNSYNPHVAKTVNGEIYAIYNCFIYGNYHIMLQKIGKDNKTSDEPVRLSDCPGSSCWPSISTRKDGGVWVTFTGFTHVRQFEDTYLQHYKYKARRSLFTYFTEIYAGVFKDGKLYHTGQKSGYYKGLCLNGTTGGKYPDIFETMNGSVVVTYRRYDVEMSLSKSPGVAFLVINNKASLPVDISDSTLYEDYIPHIEDGNKIYFACENDYRNTGWDKDAEWFDYEHKIELCTSMAELGDEAADTVPLEEHFICPVPIPSMEEEMYVRFERKDGTRIAWGQTHSHTNVSVCQRITDQNMDFNYRFFQDVQKSDFGAVSDHDYNQWRIDTHINHKYADFYYFKGEFVAFPAYEWTGTRAFHEGGPFGHVNPLYLEEEGQMEFFTPVDQECAGATLLKLWKQYKGRNIITVPHHTSDMHHAYNWDFFDSTMVPVVEIFQDCRGQHEQIGAMGTAAYSKTKNPGWVLDALKRGLILGFIAGGDHSGIARGGIEVDELTRTSLYKGLMNRKTYASSGAGADIVFTCNGSKTGSIVTASKGSFEFRISAAGRIMTVETVKNGFTVEKISANDCIFEYKWAAERESENDFWYVRIQLDNGEVFWSSPIWLVKLGAEW